MDLPDGLNERELRIDLESRMMLRRGEDEKGRRRADLAAVNALTVNEVTEDARGRRKTVKLFGPIIATGDGGEVNKDPTYADLLEAAARILRSQEPEPTLEPEGVVDA